MLHDDAKACRAGAASARHQSVLCRATATTTARWKAPGATVAGNSGIGSRTTTTAGTSKIENAARIACPCASVAYWICAARDRD